MLFLLKRVFVFLLLLIYGRHRRDAFRREVVQHCKKRRNRRNLPAITEELDDLLELPENCVDDVSFVGFTKDGQIVSCRITKADKEYAGLSLDFPGIGRFSYSHSRSLHFGTGPLNLQVLEPMRRWKVSFNGCVERVSKGKGAELISASVSLFWQCLGDPFDHSLSLSNWQLARNLADIAWDYNAWNSVLTKEIIRYEQWGELWGNVEIEGNGSQFIRLKSFRKRNIARCGNKYDEKCISHHLVQDNGCYYIANGGVCGSNGCFQERLGYLMLPLGERRVTDQSTMAMTAKRDGTSIRYPTSVYENGKSFEIDEVGGRDIPTSMQTDAFQSNICFRKYTINGSTAYGLSCRETLTLSHRQRSQLPVEKDDNSATRSGRKELVITLDDEDCRLATCVGGKAKNLSNLRGLGLRVPNAICITTHALDNQIESTTELKQSLELIKIGVRNQKIAADLSKVCAEAVQLLKDSPVCENITKAIEHELIRVFGQEIEDMHFAVRSSSVREDGKEISYAGQMESFLGVKGRASILRAVSNCWASSVAYQVVEYRRQNGQPVIEPMAVIIQEMVDADVAGVLFTNDPVTSNAATMVINAAPGLGETVVSGKCTPDTIRVLRGNTPDKLDVIEKVTGEMTFKIVCAKEDGVTEIPISESCVNQLCISDQQIVEICRLGALLEEKMGQPQDVEWAISKDQLFLLQTRPITSRVEETEEELMHEFDTPIAMDDECCTRCNIGEIFPGVATTLTQDLFVKACSDGIARYVMACSGAKIPKYPMKTGMCFTNRPFLGMTALSLHMDCFLQDKPSYDISLAGRVLDEHTMESIQAFKGGPVSMFGSLKAFVDTTFFKLPRHVKWYSDWEKTLEYFSIEKDALSASSLYASIDDNIHYYYDNWRSYIYATTRSFIPFGIMYGILKGRSASVSNQVNADIAVLLSNCPKVYTADVPRAMQVLANAIADSDIKETFLQIPDEAGNECLMNADGPICKTYERFLRMHGHRAVRENEFMEKSWRADPSKLMHVLKRLIKSPSNQSSLYEEAKPNSQVVEMLQTPLSRVQKYIIQRFLLDKAKAGIALRESSKSLGVKTSDAFKRAYWKLAELMVTEGRLPNQKLLFFLTHLEIGTLLETRSPALIRKAKRRMKVLAKQDAIEYPRITFGQPVPIARAVEPTSDTALSVTGMPVGKGVAIGRACVVLNLDEADTIQTGDILICPFTDIGWSPYFTMITGLVTDMGGLISHGSVVAREVGIPCVVNAVNATRVFKTGDRVKIDGLAGTVQKLVD